MDCVRSDKCVWSTIIAISVLQQHRQTQLVHVSVVVFVQLDIRAQIIFVYRVLILHHRIQSDHASVFNHFNILSNLYSGSMSAGFYVPNSKQFVCTIDWWVDWYRNYVCFTWSGSRWCMPGWMHSQCGHKYVQLEQVNNPVKTVWFEYVLEIIYYCYSDDNFEYILWKLKLYKTNRHVFLLMNSYSNWASKYT